MGKHVWKLLPKPVTQLQAHFRSRVFHLVGTFCSKEVSRNRLSSVFGTKLLFVGICKRADSTEETKLFVKFLSSVAFSLCGEVQRRRHRQNTPSQRSKSLCSRTKAEKVSAVVWFKSLRSDKAIYIAIMCLSKTVNMTCMMR